MQDLAEVYQREKRLAKADALFRRVLEARQRVLGPEHPGVAETLLSLGSLELEQRKHGEAEKRLREAVGIREKKGGGTWELYYSQAMLGAALAGLGRRTEAAPMIASAYQALIQKKDSIPSEKRQLLDTVRRWNLQIR
jgi:tetratricopeptide (TPR) repeat protein